MFFPLIYWVVLPMTAGWLVIRWINKHAPYVPPPDVQALWRERPLERRWFRAARRAGERLDWLGDFEKQPEAVDAAYKGMEEARDAGQRASFLVFNDKAELLEQVDS